MKFVVYFSESIQLQPIQKQIEPTQSVQNLMLLISLNYNQVDTCKLIYKEKQIINMGAQLSTIFQSDDKVINQISIVKKSDLQSFMDGAKKGYEKYSSLVNQRQIVDPKVAGALIAVAIVTILILLTA